MLWTMSFWDKWRSNPGRSFRLGAGMNTFSTAPPPPAHENPTSRRNFYIGLGTILAVTVIISLVVFNTSSGEDVAPLPNTSTGSRSSRSANPSSSISDDLDDADSPKVKEIIAIALTRLEDQCSFCFEMYFGEEKPKNKPELDLLEVLPCSHTFHQKCINDWFNLNEKKGISPARTCPMCFKVSKREVNPIVRTYEQLTKKAKKSKKQA